MSIAGIDPFFFSPRPYHKPATHVLTCLFLSILKGIKDHPSYDKNIKIILLTLLSHFGKVFPPAKLISYIGRASLKMDD